MNIRIFQKGFNYSQDGPGNRLVYHMQGCNMRCPWCANPEGMSFDGGREIPIDDLIDEVLRSRAMFFDGGGVTFTGGEPTAQFDALKELLARLKEKGVNTAIESNASHPRMGELFPLLDHVLMDLKLPDPQTHAEITGVPIDNVLKNIRLACETAGDVTIHIPTINGYNASEASMRALAALLADMPKANLRVEPLRYHEYGKRKWEELGKPYVVKDGFITDEQMILFRKILSESGLTTVHT